MKFKPSRRLKAIGSYPFSELEKEVMLLKKRGIKIIDFGVGDPKCGTPTVVRNNCKRAIDKRRYSGYPSYIGDIKYRSAISEWYKKRFNLDLDPEREISSTVGAKEAIFNFPEAFINPGDIVLIPNPGYPPYSRGTIFAEGKPYYLPLLKENNFLPDLNSIPDEIIKKAKILWINYPNNPTTAIATKQFYKEVIDFGHDNHIIIASDECYSEIYYEEKPISILELEREGVIVFQSMSKRSAMTQYRIGWVAGDEDIIKIFRLLKTNIDSGTPTFIQDAAAAALGDENHVTNMRNEYKCKMRMMIKALTSLGLEDCTPKATIYIWQHVNTNSLEFAKKLLREAAIVTTPGVWLSTPFEGINPGEGYIRIALVPTIQECKEAVERLMKLGSLE